MQVHGILQGGGRRVHLGNGRPGQRGASGHDALGLTGGQPPGPEQRVGADFHVGHFRVADGEFIKGPHIGRQHAALDGQVQHLDEVAVGPRAGDEGGFGSGRPARLGGEQRAKGVPACAPRAEGGPERDELRRRDESQGCGGVLVFNVTGMQRRAALVVCLW